MGVFLRFFDLGMLQGDGSTRTEQPGPVTWGVLI